MIQIANPGTNLGLVPLKSVASPISLGEKNCIGE